MIAGVVYQACAQLCYVASVLLVGTDKSCQRVYIIQRLLTVVILQFQIAG